MRPLLYTAFISLRNTKSLTEAVLNTYSIGTYGIVSAFPVSAHI